MYLLGGQVGLFEPPAGRHLTGCGHFEAASKRKRPLPINCPKLPFPTERTDWHVTGEAIAKDKDARAPKHNHNLDFILNSSVEEESR
jgi:hypothetical protein